MPRVFISYARIDDEPFVARLTGALRERGVEVWWDRHAMESRGRTFLQEIRDAIASVDRLLLVVGPAAGASEYVEAEWRFAAETCTPIVPVLRQADYDAVPEVRRFHGVDFREPRPFGDALDELLRILMTAVPPLGPLYGVSPLPPHHLPRDNELSRLSDCILAAVRTPEDMPALNRATGLYGMAGCGKSVLAAAFARLCEGRRTFPDGIVWCRVGIAPNLAGVLQAAARALGDEAAHLYTDAETAVDRLAEFLGRRACLIVADDVWRIEDLELLVRVPGPRCHLLFTTRDRRLVTDVAAGEVEVGLLAPTESAALLASWSGAPTPADLPAEAMEVAIECGNLPLALSMLGAMVRGRPDRWRNILSKLREADLAAIRRRMPNYPHLDLLRAIDVSVEALDAEVAERYRDLVVFAQKDSVPAETLYTYWGRKRISPRDADDLIDLLEDRSLLRRDGHGRITLHDLQYDYLRATVLDVERLHRELLEAYATVCADGWPTGPADGYFFQNLLSHLVHAGRASEVSSLLLNPDWLESKVRATSPAELVGDFAVVRDSAPHALVAGALQLSAHVIGDNPHQVRSQLLGRLLDRTEPPVQQLLDEARRVVRTDLQPLTASLMSPGGALSRTIGPHAASWVGGFDERGHVVSVGTGGAISVWDATTGKRLQAIETGTTVADCAITPDGRFVAMVPHAAAKDAQPVLVWEVPTASLIVKFDGGEHPIKRIFGLADSRRLLTLAAHVTPDASLETTVGFWDLAGKDHQGFVAPLPLSHCASCAAAPLVAFAGYAGHILLFDTFQQQLAGTQKADLGVDHLALSSDGRFLVAAAQRSTGAAPFLGEAALQELRQLKIRMRGDPFYDQLDLFQEGAADPDAAAYGLTVWDVGTNEVRHTLPGHPARVSALCAVPGTSRLVSASWDGSLKMWDLQTGNEVATYRAHSAPVVSLTVSRDGRRAASAGEDDTLKVWDLTIPPEDVADRPHAGVIIDVQWLAAAGIAVSGDTDGWLKLWDPDRGALLRALSCGSAIETFTCSDDGRWVAYGAGEKVQVMDLAPSQPPITLGEHPGGVVALVVAGDEGLVSAGVDGTIRWWNVRDRAQTAAVETGEANDYGSDRPDPITFMQATPDGTHVAAVTYRFLPDFGKGMRNVMAFDERGGQKQVFATIFTYWRYHGDTWLLARQKGLVSALDKGDIGMWDLPTGERRQTLTGAGRRVVRLAATPDERFVLAALEDGSIATWDVGDGSLVNRTIALPSPITMLTTSPDGRYVASATQDGGLQVWTGDGREPLARFCADSPVASATFAGTDRLVAADEAGCVHILKIVEPMMVAPAA